MKIFFKILILSLLSLFIGTAQASEPVKKQDVTVYDIIDTYIKRKDLFDKYYKSSVYVLNAYVIKIEKIDDKNWKLYFNDNLIFQNRYQYEFTCKISHYNKNKITKNKSFNDKIYINLHGNIKDVKIQKPETHVDYETRTLELDPCYNITEIEK